MASNSYAQTVRRLCVEDVQLQQIKILVKDLQTILVATGEQLVQDTNHESIGKLKEENIIKLVVDFFIKKQLITCEEVVQLKPCPIPEKELLLISKFGILPNWYWLRAGLYQPLGSICPTLHIYLWPVVKH